MKTKTLAIWAMACLSPLALDAQGVKTRTNKLGQSPRWKPWDAPDNIL